MSKQSGLGAGLYVGGVDIGGDIGSVQRIASPRGVLDLTDITQSAYERRLTLRDGGIDLSAWFNPARAHPALSALPRTDTVATYRHTAVAGAPAACMVAKQINYDGNRQQDASYALAVSLVANGYGLEWCIQLTAGTRTDGSATVGAAVDQGSASPGAFGLQMYVQLLAFTGTSVTIKLQESSDNGADTYADVVGATTGALTTAPQAVRIATGAINVERFLKVVTVGTFSNAVFHVAAVRNPVAVSF